MPTAMGTNVNSTRSAISTRPTPAASRKPFTMKPTIRSDKDRKQAGLDAQDEQTSNYSGYLADGIKMKSAATKSDEIITWIMSLNISDTEKDRLALDLGIMPEGF